MFYSFQGSSHGRSLPLVAMAKSLPLWGITIACFCTDWLFYMLLTSMPTFMSNVLHFDLREVSAALHLRLVRATATGLGPSVGWEHGGFSGTSLPEDQWVWDQGSCSLGALGSALCHGCDNALFPALQNGLLSSLPYIGNGLGHILSGLLADFLLAKRVLSTAAVRKLFSALGKDKLSSALQPCQHTLALVWPVTKHPIFLPRDAAPSCLPGGRALHRLQFYSCCGPSNAGLDNNQHDRGRHQY